MKLLLQCRGNKPLYKPLSDGVILFSFLIDSKAPISGAFFCLKFC